MPDEQDVPLDPAMIKVLASDTRLDILKQLKQRRMTLTELSNALGLKKATILEHLERLTTAGLVRRMDDGERLWVYYELTRRGGYVVTPGRTRFYLLVAGSAVAGVVAVALFLSMAANVPQPAPPTGGVFHVAETSAVSGDALHASLGPGFVGPTQSFLLPAAEAQAMLHGQPGILGLPLEQHEEAGVLELRPAHPVPTGNYYVYVRDAFGHDNLATMQKLFIQGVDAQVLPQVWWRGVDADAQARVGVGGAAVNGSLLVVPAGNPSADALLAVPLRNGGATLGAGALDDGAPGTYELRLLRPDNVSVPLPASLQVREPGVAIAPLSVLAGQAADLQVTVTAPGSGASASVRANGSLLGDARGASLLQLPPRSAGFVDVEVGRVAHAQVAVVPDFRLALRAANGSFELTLQDARGPVTGADVLLDGQAVGATNATGQLVLALPNGTHVLGLGAAQGSAARGISVQGSSVRDAPRSVDVSADGPADVAPGGFTLTAHLRSSAVVPQRVTLAVDVDGQLAAAQAVDLAPRGAANATLRIVADGGSHQVVVRALLPPQPALSTPAPASSPTPSPAPSGSAGATSTSPSASMDTGLDTSLGTPAVLRVDVPPVFGQSADQARLAAGYEAISLSPALMQKEAAKTPGFQAALLALAVLGAAAMLRRRR